MQAMFDVSSIYQGPLDHVYTLVGYRYCGQPIPAQQCVICHGHLKAKDEHSRPHTIKCGHQFHEHCIDKWFNNVIKKYKQAI
jgi:hypothetical protein